MKNEMCRSGNIAKSKIADERIINHLKICEGFEEIIEIKDSQTNRNNLKGLAKLENDINMKLGIDYIVVVNGENKYIDTKGFSYSYKNYGRIDENGVVERMLIQIEKCYGGVKYKGWANNPQHWTQFVLILINDKMYTLDYKKLVEYCDRFDEKHWRVEQFKKLDYNGVWYGSYDLCIHADVKEMLEEKIIIDIRDIN